MIRHFHLQLMVGALLFGCAESPNPPFDQPVANVTRACEPQSAAPFLLSRHVLVSDSEGNIPADRHGGSLPEAFRTIMGGYAEAVRQNPDRPPRLLFYFNGGLNSQAQVEQQARRQVPCMLADGYYPVFFIWDTEGLASYWEQVSSVWDGQVDRSFPVRARTPLMVLGNVISGIGQAPADYAIHGRRFVRAIRRKPVCWLVVRGDPDEPDELRDCPDEQRVTFVDQVGGRISPDANVVAPRPMSMPTSARSGGSSPTACSCRFAWSARRWRTAWARPAGPTCFAAPARPSAARSSSISTGTSTAPTAARTISTNE